VIKGVAFDLEGTIIDLEWAHWQGHLAAAQEAGLSLSLEQAIREIPCFIGGPDERISETIAKLCGNNTGAAILPTRSKYHFQKLLASVQEIRPRPGFLDVLKTILERGIPVAIGSLTDTFLATRLIRNSGLDSYFYSDKVVLKENVAKLKPAPDVYLHTAKALGVSPEEQLVFEDSVNGVIAARSAGSKVIAVPIVQSSEFVSQLLGGGALCVVRAWSEINMDIVLDDPNDSKKED